MKTELKAWCVLGGFVALLWRAMSSDGGPWFYITEAIASVVILLAASGLISGRSVGESR